jgi:protein-disulfide isomerase
MRRKLPIIIIVGVLIVALAGGALLMQPSETTTRQNIAQLPPTITTPKPQATDVPRPAAPPNIAPITHLRGRNDAPVLLEEYGDFQCPPCGYLHPILKRLEGEYATQLRVAFHHFPLRERHANAAEAARAAEAAGLQGKFWQMHDLLFDKQKDWKDAAPARPMFLSYARTLGLDVQKFAQDMNSTTVSNRLMVDEQGGASRGVMGTPTVFLNGREIPFEVVTSYDKLRAVIESELASKK